MSNTKIWAISIISLLCGWMLIITGRALIPVIWAVFLAFFIHPVVIWVQHRLKTQKKAIAVCIVLVIIITLMSILLQFIMPPIINQMMTFGREFTGYSQQFMDEVDALWHYLDGFGLDSRITNLVEDAISQILLVLSDVIWTFITIVLGYLFRITDFVIIAILLFYFLMDGPMMVGYIINRMPQVLREAASNFVDGISGVIWGYMRNQVIYSVTFGILSYVAFAILRLPFAGVLALTAGFLNMIPYFGSIISGIVAVVVALIYFEMGKVLITLAVILALNLVLGNIMVPMLQGRTLNLHPSVVITALLAGNYLWGAIGMLVAVPLLALARLLLREIMGVVERL